MLLVHMLHFICTRCHMAWKEAEAHNPESRGVCPRCNLRNDEPVEESDKVIGEDDGR